MTQHSVAKTYVHLINVKHMQVPLYQSRGVARGEFSNPLFTSGSFFNETRYTMKHDQENNIILPQLHHLQLYLELSNSLWILVYLKTLHEPHTE
jgi:hypothetical protein